MITKEIQKKHGNCSMCNNQIELNSNPSGLVINDQHFICENCCTSAEKPILMNHVKEKSMGSSNIRPILMWLWEKNKK